MRHLARLSLSSLGRARVCPGSAVLPWVRSRNVPAVVGNGTHDWIDVTARLDGAVREWGRAAGRGELDDIATRWELWGEARETFGRYVRGLGGCPVPPEGLTEVALCLLEDGDVVPVKGSKGDYEMPPDGLIAGTLDAMWCERDVWRDGRYETEAVPFLWPDARTPRVFPGSRLFVPDWKTGDAVTTPPAAFNWQIKGAALLAARWTGGPLVLPALGLIDGGPVRWEMETDRHGAAIVLDEAALAGIEAEIRRVVARVRAQNPQNPEVETGPHCTYCPAKTACPAHVAAPRAMIEAIPNPKAVGPLTRDEARRLLPIVLAVEPARKAALDALKAHVDVESPIDLPDGRRWYPGEEPDGYAFATGPTFEALVEALMPFVGEERAVEVAHGAFRTTKDALWEALNSVLDPLNEERKAAGLKRIVKKQVAEPMFERLAKVGAMTERRSIEYRARWPKGEKA